jgi:uncharacterized glyoxalase superfamily protein PhnB
MAIDAERRKDYRGAMLRNRSVLADVVLPHIAYKDLPAAIDWLSRTFGMIEHYRYGNPIAGAQVRIGGAWIMIHTPRGAYRSPAELGFGTQSLTIFIADIEEYYVRVQREGAKLFEELHETEYGELQFGVEDLEGHRWLFSRHARDLDPDAWGATIVNADVEQ